MRQNDDDLNFFNENPRPSEEGDKAKEDNMVSQITQTNASITKWDSKLEAVNKITAGKMSFKKLRPTIVHYIMSYITSNSRLNRN